MEIAGFIISGSVHNMSDGKGSEWKDGLCGFVRTTHAVKPTLGVCFGHQLVAHALGGMVERTQGEKELGCVSLFLTQEGKQGALFQGFGDGSCVPMSHGDIVTKLPHGAIRLAGNEYSANQAFRIGMSWGVQFHPELQPVLFKKLLAGRRDRFFNEGNEIGAEKLQAVSDSLRPCPDAINVLLRFVGLCF